MPEVLNYLLSSTTVQASVPGNWARLLEVKVDGDSFARKRSWVGGGWLFPHWLSDSFDLYYSPGARCPRWMMHRGDIG